MALTIHAAWFGLTAAAAKMPWWAVLPLGAFVVAWHGSLQHETIHGHPTRWRRVNALVGALPVGLWMPYRLYRDLHLAHHRTAALTDPLEDPESYYLTDEAWRASSPLARALHRANMSLAGRIVLGPALTVGRFFVAEARRVASGDRRHVRAWVEHLAGVALVVAWLELVCGVSFARYVALFVYPGVGLALVRSFAEHRPGPTNKERIAIVEAGPIASLLFLNNNLHVVHHAEPALPWYRIPARYRASRDALIAGNGGYFYGGYGELFARFGLRAKDAPVHPGR